MLGGSGRFAWAGRACSSGGGDDERRDGRADGEAEEERALARVEAIDGTCGRARGWPRRARRPTRRPTLTISRAVVTPAGVKSSQKTVSKTGG